MESGIIASRSRVAAVRLTAVALVGLSAAAAAGHQAAPPRVVHITAERFSFTPSDITVDQGTVVELRLTSEDTAHGFRLSGPRQVDVAIPKRGRGDVRVVFEAAEPGTYTFECSRVCGAGHSFMRGRIRVRAADRDGGPAGGREDCSEAHVPAAERLHAARPHPPKAVDRELAASEIVETVR
jgi:cytochrome c oxidase subunit 2